MKIDSIPSVSKVGESAPTPAAQTGQKLSQPAASPLPAETQESSHSSSQQFQSIAVNYQLAENGHKVYFQVIDENTGQIISQVPSSAVLNGEEQLYQFLHQQEQAKPEKG